MTTATVFNSLLILLLSLFCTCIPPQAAARFPLHGEAVAVSDLNALLHLKVPLPLSACSQLFRYCPATILFNIFSAYRPTSLLPEPRTRRLSVPRPLVGPAVPSDLIWPQRLPSGRTIIQLLIFFSSKTTCFSFSHLAPGLSFVCPTPLCLPRRSQISCRPFRRSSRCARILASFSPLDGPNPNAHVLSMPNSNSSSPRSSPNLRPS